MRLRATIAAGALALVAGVRAALQNVTVEDTSYYIRYAPYGSWNLGPAYTTPNSPFDSNQHSTSQPGANATFAFFGSAIYVYSQGGPYFGPAAIGLDGKLESMPSSYYTNTSGPILLWSQDGLDLNVQHVFVMAQLRLGPPFYIEIDAIVITTDPTIVQPGSPSGAAGTFSNVSSTTYPSPFATETTGFTAITSATSVPSSSQVSVGATVGAVVGALLVGLLIAAGIWAVCRRRRRRREAEDGWPKVENGPELVAGAPYRPAATIDEDDEPKNGDVVSVAPYAMPSLAARNVDRIEPAPLIVSPEMAYLPHRTATLRSAAPPSPADSTGPLMARSTQSSITDALGSGSNRHLAPALSLSGPRRDGASQWYAGAKADAGAPTPLSASAPGGGFFAMAAPGGGDVKADPPADTYRANSPSPGVGPVASGSGAAAVVRTPTPQGAEAPRSPLSPDDVRDPGRGTTLPEDAPPEYVRES